MTGSYPKAEILTGPQRRRRRTSAEKLAIIAETREPGMTVIPVARRYGIAPNQLFTWRRLAEQGALTATQAEEEVVPASAFRAQQEQIPELQRLLGKKTLEAEILKEALEVATGQKTPVAVALATEGEFPMTRLCETIGIARSHVGGEVRRRSDGAPPKRRGRPPLPDDELLAEIEAVIAEMLSYGYARVWAILRRKAQAEGRAWPNRKRVYRVMRLHGLLLQRHAGGNEARRHDGEIAVNRSNLRWCSDGFEIACDNQEKVCVAFALDCCDREAMGHVATTEGIKSEDVRDLMVTALEHRFGQIDRLPTAIEWLTDNGSCYTAIETRRLAREIGFMPLTTPVESPQSNGMAEAFVWTFKRDYVEVNPKPDAATVIRSLHGWFEHDNDLHPHRALGYRSPRAFIAKT
jgi:putative transposase